MTAASAIRQPLWSTLRTLSDPASVPELAGAIGAPASSIAWRLSRWAQAGLLTAIPANDRQGRTRYLMPDTARTLATPPALDAARRPSAKRGGRTAMWRAIRILKRFDLVQLCMTAEVTEASAKVYVSALLRAGILRCAVRGNATTGQRSVYMLAGTFGPLVPVIGQRREGGRTITTVTDPNTGTTREISAHPPLPPLF